MPTNNLNRAKGIPIAFLKARSPNMSPTYLNVPFLLVHVDRIGRRKTGLPPVTPPRGYDPNCGRRY